jgi:hypothetical protein
MENQSFIEWMKLVAEKTKPKIITVYKTKFNEYVGEEKRYKCYCGYTTGKCNGGGRKYGEC